MKKLDHFILPEHYNELYSKEAISAISLTRDIADKINELVDLYNQINDDDLVWKQEIEGTIRKGVVFMKDNLLNSLNDLMTIFRDSGFIDDRIEYHCETLKLQLDNLINSETVDEELIDLRVANGVSYSSAGESFRNSLYNIIKQSCEYMNNLENNEVVYTKYYPGYIDAEFKMHEPNAVNKEITSDYIPLEANDIYLIKATFDNSDGVVHWKGITYYDSNMIAISRESEETNDDRIIIQPNEDVRYFRISVRTFGNSSLLILKKKLDTISKEIPIYNHKYDYEYINMNFHLGYYNSAGENLAPTSTGVEMSSDLVPVKTGDKYALIINALNEYGIVGNHAGYLWGAVAFYDSEGKFLYRPHSYTATEETADKKYNIVGEFMIPAGVSYIRVMGRTYWNGSINLAIKKDLLSQSTANVSFENMCSNIKGIAHRGYSATYPENTLKAYIEAKRKGFYYVECDVRFTSDGVPVLLHDASIDRTSNGTGNIAALTFNEVNAFDFGSWFSPEFEGTSITTFKDFIGLCKKIGLHPYIELKAGTEEQIENLVTIIKSYDMLNNVTFIGGSPYITYLTNIISSGRIGITVSSITDSNTNEGINLKNKGFDVFMNSNSYTDAEIEMCKSKGLSMEVWTINSESTIVGLNGYISGVTSDYLHAGIVSYENI